jgi:peptidoglycan/xylan/chitin deacetylase (PgdA/CDA1 family)
VNPLLRRSAARLLGVRGVNRAVRAVAAARGHALVLVYHRLGPPRPTGQVVPSVPVEVFRAQLHALGELVDFVSLDAVVDRTGRDDGSGRRPAVAVTFDDDLPSHLAHALPVLRETSVPATFFLSGRALNGRGPYWFQPLEALLDANGAGGTAALLRLADTDTEQMVLACERDAELRRRVTTLASELPSPALLEPPAMATLSAAGATIGFHTLEHEALPGLDDAGLDDAVARGRDDLARAVAAPVRFFAYPHGKADTRTAAAVRRAGFDAAFTGRRQPVRRGDDRYRLGRWEPGPLAVDDLLVELAVRLHIADSPAPASRPWM